MPKSAPKTVAKVVRRKINQVLEHKFIDTALSVASTVSYSGEVLDLTAIAQTTTQATDTSRIGDNVTPTSIDIRMWVSYNSTSIYNVFRVILFRWNTMDSTHGISPTAGSVLQYTGDVDSVNSPLINDSRGLSTVIWDKTIRMDNASQQGCMLRFRKKLARKKINFYATTTEGQFKYYLCLISNRAADFPTLTSGWSRIRFFDA